MKIQHTGQGQLFKNPVLEKLTRTHAFVPVAIFYTVSAGLLYYAFVYNAVDALMLLVFFISGLFFWTFFEYMAHRFAFHMDTNTKLKAWIQYTFHGIHHEYPRDKQRVAMPPVASVILSSVIIIIFRLVFGIPGFPLVAGFLSGYATYLLIHYSIHAKIPPKSFIGKLWMHHSIHHYKDDTVAFGVSSPLWDMVFGTMPKKYR